MSSTKIEHKNLLPDFCLRLQSDLLCTSMGEVVEDDYVVTIDLQGDLTRQKLEIDVVTYEEVNHYLRT